MKSLSCVQLCDPVGGSPPGSSVHEILQARTLERVAMSFSRLLPHPDIKLVYTALILCYSNIALEWVNLTQMIIISTTVGRNHLEKLESPSYSTEESEMQYLDAISKRTK